MCLWNSCPIQRNSKKPICASLSVCRNRGSTPRDGTTSRFEDNGPGFAAHMKQDESAFDYFTRHAPGVPLQPWAGLGLAMVKKKVEDHGGSVGNCRGSRCLYSDQTSKVER